LKQFVADNVITLMYNFPNSIILVDVVIQTTVVAQMIFCRLANSVVLLRPYFLITKYEQHAVDMLIDVYVVRLAKL